jgi:hypothetical protein
MKNKVYGLIMVLVMFLSIGGFMQSCSSEDEYFSDTIKIVDSQQANLIALEYMELIDNQYILNLSEEKAIALGISKFDYDRMHQEIRQANAFIIDCQKNGIEIDLNDPQKVQINIQKVRLKNGNEVGSWADWTWINGENGNSGNSGGSFVMQETGAGGSWSGSVPNGATKIKITLTSACVIGSCSGYIVCGGTSITYSIVGLCGGSTTKDLPMGNTNITVTGNTVCSGGGTVVISFQ